MAQILHSTMETDLRLAAALDQEVRALLTDMMSIRDSGAISYHGSVNGTGSDTKRIRFAGLDGYDSMSSAAESAVSNTSLTDASADIAVARIALRYDLHDLAEFTGTGPGDINVERLSKSMVGAFNQGFNSLVANVIDDFSTNVGTSGVDMSADDFFDATYQMDLNSVPGPYYAAFHGRQIADLKDSWRAEGGAHQWREDSQEVVALKGQGYQGSLLNVGIYAMSDVVAAGGNREGGLWGLGAVGYADGNPAITPNAGSQIIRPAGDSPVYVEIQRDADAGHTEIVGNAYVGVAILEQGRGVGVVTDQ